jgi:hypothetical protein
MHRNPLEVSIVRFPDAACIKICFADFERGGVLRIFESFNPDAACKDEKSPGFI